MAERFRQFTFASDSPRVSMIKGDYREHTEFMRHLTGPRGSVEDMINNWAATADEPYQGITVDGKVIPGLYELEPDGAPVQEMVDAADRLTRILTAEERARLSRPIDAAEWRRWNNAEVYIFEYGLRLEELPGLKRDAVLAVIRASLSDAGYATTRHTMWVNKFIGELLDRRGVFNEWSYNFTIFGDVSLHKPWGWQLMGHHISLNCVVIDGQLWLSPIFLGAEPNRADAGEYAGVELFAAQASLALELVRALPASLRKEAVIFSDMRDPSLPPGRLHFADQLHLGAAFQDNRVIPYEGPAATAFPEAQRRKLMETVASHLDVLPRGSRTARLRSIEKHVDQTHFSWIGGTGDEDPFYYRIQSPVIMIEFDNHSGVLLSHQAPEKFHVHTIVRSPNGNDYGRDLLAQHYAKEHQKEEAEQ